jgi:hypothetical protein
VKDAESRRCTSNQTRNRTNFIRQVSHNVDVLVPRQDQKFHVCQAAHTRIASDVLMQRILPETVACEPQQPRFSRDETSTKDSPRKTPSRRLSTKERHGHPPHTTISKDNNGSYLVQCERPTAPLHRRRSHRTIVATPLASSRRLQCPPTSHTRPQSLTTRCKSADPLRLGYTLR